MINVPRCFKITQFPAVFNSYMKMCHRPSPENSKKKVIPKKEMCLLWRFCRRKCFDGLWRNENALHFNLIVTTQALVGRLHNNTLTSLHWVGCGKATVTSLGKFRKSVNNSLCQTISAEVWQFLSRRIFFKFSYGEKLLTAKRYFRPCFKQG